MIRTTLLFKQLSVICDFLNIFDNVALEFSKTWGVSQCKQPMKSISVKGVVINFSRVWWQCMPKVLMLWCPTYSSCCLTFRIQFSVEYILILLPAWSVCLLHFFILCWQNLNQNPCTLLPKFYGLYCYQVRSIVLYLCISSALALSGSSVSCLVEAHSKPFDWKVLLAYFSISLHFVCTIEQSS